MHNKQSSRNTYVHNTTTTTNNNNRQLLADLGRRISQILGEVRESGYLFQRCSVLVQRFNAILLHDSLPQRLYRGLYNLWFAGPWLHGLMIIPIILHFSVFLNPSGIYLPRVQKIIIIKFI